MTINWYPAEWAWACCNWLN